MLNIEWSPFDLAKAREKLRTQIIATNVFKGLDTLPILFLIWYQVMSNLWSDFIIEDKIPEDKIKYLAGVFGVSDNAIELYNKVGQHLNKFIHRYFEFDVEKLAADIAESDLFDFLTLMCYATDTDIGSEICMQCKSLHFNLGVIAIVNSNEFRVELMSKIKERSNKDE